jgi:hypothetical protein
MTDKKINAAIADAISPRLVLGDSQFYKSGDGWVVDCPDYCRDLNAMHEVEKTLDSPELFCKYHFTLYDITKANIPFCATARQRAEAFLRTIGKWEDGE